MNKMHSLLYFCFILSFVCSNEYLFAKQQNTNVNTSVNDVTNGINSISKAFGDAALIFKKTYDQVDPDSIGTKNTIMDSNTKSKLLEDKLQAVIDSVKKWMTTDSNTKKEALQALQRNAEIIEKEVEKAKRQLENANNAANKASGTDKTKFNNEINASANAVSANSQYYMATKTRLDYETKYKEMIDERNRRLDMVTKINDPQTICELLSDSTNIPGKKYGEQMGDYTNTDIKLGSNLTQQSSNPNTPAQNSNNINTVNTAVSAPGVSNGIPNTNQVQNEQYQQINNGSAMATQNNNQHQLTDGNTPIWHSVNKIPQAQTKTVLNDVPKQKTPSTFLNIQTSQVNTIPQEVQNIVKQPGKQQIKYTNSKTIGVVTDSGRVESTNVISQNQTQSTTQTVNPGLPLTQNTISTVQQANIQKIPVQSQPKTAQNVMSVQVNSNTNAQQRTVQKNTINLSELLAPLKADVK